MQTNNQTQHPDDQSAIWSSGLCSCGSDISGCCLTCWCPCITFGRISEIVDQNPSICIMNGAIYMLIMMITGCGCLYSWYYRSKMREQFRLKGSICGDCVLHFCCEACSLCQEYRELKSRGFNMSIGWQGNLERRNQEVAMGRPVIEPPMKR